MFDRWVERLKDGKTISRHIEDVDDGIQDIYGSTKKLLRTLLEICVAVAGVVMIGYKAILPEFQRLIKSIPSDVGIEKTSETPNTKTFRVRGK